MAQFINPFFEGGGPIGDGSERDSSVGVPLTPNVDGGDISGGTTSAPAAAAAEQIEEFAAEGGRPLPRFYGEHFVAGSLIIHKFTAGTPNTSIVYVAIAEGQGADGGYGELDSAVALYYAGEALSVSPNGSTAGYRFYSGTMSQGVDAFLTGGLAYPGTSYVAVKIPDIYANAEDRPDKLRGRYKGRKTFDFDSVGRISPTATYSVNPARIAADMILCYYLRKSPGDFNTAVRRLQDAVDWEKWREWHDFNAVSISWDNGTSVVSIPRFECHVAFTEDVILADALDQICATCGAHWQHDGERFIFLPPSERAPVHHFDLSNIKDGSVRFERRDLRERPNYFIAEFRDLDDTFLGISSTEVRRNTTVSSANKEAGQIKTVRAFPTMHKSQADRLLERQARLESDNPVIITLTGDENSIHVLPGDFVTLSHPLNNWEYQRCLVLAVSLTGAEDGPDLCDFTLQEINDLLYSDTAHGQRMEALTP